MDNITKELGNLIAEFLLDLNKHDLIVHKTDESYVSTESYYLATSRILVGFICPTKAWAFHINVHALAAACISNLQKIKRKMTFDYPGQTKDLQEIDYLIVSLNDFCQSAIGG
jgi:hypothetical protein